MSRQIVQEMKKRVFDANLQLSNLGLVKLTWGNVSEIDRGLGVIVIKPSGIPYNKMSVDDMVVTDLDGNCLEEDRFRPSSDLATHVHLYQNFSSIGSIVHTHSSEAVGWAQSCREVPLYGTTHADAFYGPVPLTRQLSRTEIETNYERNTGVVIVEKFHNERLDPLEIPGVLVQGHGPFTWGTSPLQAVGNSLILEEICQIARFTESNNPKAESLDKYIVEKHYLRKHGDNAYYGQR